MNIEQINSKIRAELRQFEKYMLCKIHNYKAASVVIITLSCYFSFLSCDFFSAKEGEKTLVVQK